MAVAKIPTKQLGSFTSNLLNSVACATSVYAGSVVRLSGSTFVNSQSDIKANGHVFGICQAKSSTTVCDVLLPGGITSSIYTGLDVTKEYFLSVSTAGLIVVAPVSLTVGQTVWYIGKPYDTQRLLFNPKLRWIN